MSERQASILQTVWDGAKDCLFPVFCFGCEKEGEWLCQECLRSKDIGGVWACPVCHDPAPLGATCPPCRRGSALGSHAAAVAYVEQSALGRLIRAYKYKFAEEAFSVFNRLLLSFASANAAYFEGVSSVVPVPLHRRRFAERGFNQADAVARSLSDATGIPVLPCLARVRYTKQQAALSKEERKENVVGAFAMLTQRRAPGRILLVDDVYTTGSTMQECARVLLNAGAESVIGCTISRG